MEAESAFEPVAIAVAPNGGRRTKADHPAIPLTPDELACTAADCAEAGASMIHVHVRDAHGGHRLDAEGYRAAIAAIRAAVGDRLVIQITSEALGLYTPAEQIAVVKAVRPEAVSLAVRELVPDASSEIAFAELLRWLKRERVIPQIVLYTPEEATRLADLRRRGLIPWDDIPVLFVLGRYTGGQTSVPADLLPFLAPGVPRFAHWTVCAFGRHETACVSTAAFLGGHVRVGLENNLWLANGQMATSNADLVNAVVETLTRCGYAIQDSLGLATSMRMGRPPV